MYGTRDARCERIDHHRVVAEDRASLVVVSGRFEEMTRTRMRVGHRDHETIHADAVRPRGQRRDAAVQEGRAEGEICDDESQAVAAAVGQDEHARIQSQPIADCLGTLGAVARQPDARRRRDVDAGEPGLQRRRNAESWRGAEHPRHV